MENIQRAIIERNINYITKYFLDDDDSLRAHAKLESELWDYKESLPAPGRKHINSWARIAKYVLAFYNNKGGILFFGIKDNFEVCKVSAEIDSKKFNDQLKKFLSDRIYIEFINYSRDVSGKYIGIAIIPPRGSVIEKFISDAPYDGDKRLFKKGESAIRMGDQSIILTINDLEKYKQKEYIDVNNTYAVDIPMFRILSPDYKNFVYRKPYCEEIIEGLKDDRTLIVSITGIGGIGKTALATWAVLKCYNENVFNFIISVTAKDRDLTRYGINSIIPTITTFDTLLISIIDVLGLTELKELGIEDQEKEILSLLRNSGGLLYIDNLETIEDDRIINFLSSLPFGIKAITTSRRSRVRFSLYPIPIEKMSQYEVFEYLKKLSSEHGLLYLSKITQSQSNMIGHNVDQIPLAIKWCAKRSSTIQELLSLTQEIKQSGKSSEELLEFSYRRIFEKMTNAEKSILYALACLDRSVETSLILFICNQHDDIEDFLDTLCDDSLILKIFNPNSKLYEFSLMPLTRNFILTQLKNSHSNEKQIRLRIEMYYNATDISDKNERESMKIIRNQGEDKASVYVNLANMAMRDKNYEAAEKHLKSALLNNKNSFKAHWQLAELYRHHLNNTPKALEHYRYAEELDIKNIQDKISFFREYGRLLLFAKDKNCKTEAKKHFEASLSNGYDSISVNKLSELLLEEGKFDLVINLITKYVSHMSNRDKLYIYPHLLKAYKYKNEPLKYHEIDTELKKINSSL